MSKEFSGHIRGGPPGYTEVDPRYSANSRFGSTEFGQAYNTRGVEVFNGAARKSGTEITVDSAKRSGPEITFRIEVPPSGQNVLFGNRRQGKGNLLGPIGQLPLGDGRIRVISLVYTETDRGFSTVAVSGDVDPSTQERPPLTFCIDNNRPDIRESPAIIRIPAIFPPLRGGRSLSGTRLTST